MLLIDGNQYEEWIPKREVEEFHPIVIEHCKDIFGHDSIYLEARNLKSPTGAGSRPDGFVMTFGRNPQWHIVEIELSSPAVYDHIVNQVGRFINGIGNPITQRNVTEALHQELTATKTKKAAIEEAIGSGDVHKFVTDLGTVKKYPMHLLGLRVEWYNSTHHENHPVISLSPPIPCR